MGLQRRRWARRPSATSSYQSHPWLFPPPKCPEPQASMGRSPEKQAKLELKMVMNNWRKDQK